MTDALRPAVAACDEGASYGAPPYDPVSRYPEAGPLEAAGGVVGRAEGCSCPGGSAYDLVRSSLSCYDRERYGTESWNPLRALIGPGESVVIKPNLVIHRRLGFGDLVTHAAVLRCILDYTCLALGGAGRITVCDAPIQGADFSRLVRETGLQEVIDQYNRLPNLTVSLVDLRREWARIDDESSYIVERLPLPGDPAGDTLFDLGRASALEEVSREGTRLAVGDYDAVFTSENHRRGRHRYRFSNTVLDADVVLNVAKMKTHQKAGVTGALKNIVGMNTSKDYLPHFRMGPPPDGDEFPASFYNSFVARGKSGLQERVPLPLWRVLRRAAGLVQAGLRRRGGGEARYGLLGGSWAGNDTAWRMVIDINRIARFGGRDGQLHSSPRRRIYHCVDGIVAGEGEGPLRSTPRPVGLFLHGSDAAVVDALMSALMGFDPDAVPLVRNAFDPRFGLSGCHGLSHAPVLLDSNLVERLRRGEHFGFEPPRGWPCLKGSVSPALLAQMAGDSSGDTRAFLERGSR